MTHIAHRNVSLIVRFIFCLFCLIAYACPGNAASIAKSGFDFPALFDESVALHARQDGFQLVVKENRCAVVPKNHEEMTACLEFHTGWNPVVSGFSAVDEIQAVGNPVGRDDNFILDFSGYFHADTAGIWAFSINSASAAELLIDGLIISSWYGSHPEGGPYEEHSSTTYLRPGWHHVRLLYAAGAGNHFVNAVFAPPGEGGWLPLSVSMLDIKSLPLKPGILVTTHLAMEDDAPQDELELFHAVERASMADALHSGHSIIDSLDLDENPHGDDGNFTARFSAWFQVAETDRGTWTFAVNSADASNLEIDGTEVASWYGSHASAPDSDHSRSGAITLEPGWHELVCRYASPGDGSPRMLVSFKKPGSTQWHTLSSANLSLMTAGTDLDNDGIPNDLETIIGTSAETPDSDLDILADLAEMMLGSDPLKADSNGDGLGDYSEIISGQFNATTGRYDNIWNSDNDGDQVPDGLDLSPGATTTAHDTFSFEVTTSGKSTYLEFQVRPANSMNLMLMNQKWDWPYDDKGNMQDRDNSTEDITLVPMLVLTTNMAPAQNDVKDAGIQITNDIKMNGFDGRFRHGDGFAVGDVLGSGHRQTIVAWDKTHKISIYDSAGVLKKRFLSKFSQGDLLLAADVCDDEKDEIVVLHRGDGKLYVYEGGGQLLTSHEMDFDIYSEASIAAAGDYANAWSTIRGPMDLKEEIVIGNPDSGKLRVVGVEHYSNGNIWRLTSYFSSAGLFTPDDGLAMADVDGDGKDEIVVAGNVDDVLNIYHYEGSFYNQPSGYCSSSTVFCKAFSLSHFDFDLSDSIAGMDAVPSDDPSSPTYGDEIVVFKKSGLIQIYTETSRVQSPDRADYSDNPAITSFPAATFRKYMAMGDIDGDGTDETLIGTYFIMGKQYIFILDQDQNITDKIPVQFRYHDTLLAADILGDGKDEIIVLSASDGKMRIYDRHGNILNVKSVSYHQNSVGIVADYTRHGKEDVIVGDPETGKIYVYSIESSGNLVTVASSGEMFTENDGLATADIDGDGALELLVAHDLDNILKIYRNKLGRLPFTPAGELVNFNFDKGCNMAGIDVLPSSDPEDHLSGAEIAVFMPDGKVELYNEVKKLSNDGEESVDYSSFDATAADDVAGDPSAEIVVASDTTGIVNIYNTRYKKAFIPLSPVTDNGGTVAFQGRMIYSATGDGPVTLNADVKLVWFVMGNTDSEEEPDANRPIVLAQYEDPFIITGFSATEQRSFRLAVAYSGDRENTALAYNVMKEKFIHGQDSIVQGLDHAHDLVQDLAWQQDEFRNDHEAYQWMETRLQELVTSPGTLPAGIQPIMMVQENMAVASGLEAFASVNGTATMESFSMDLNALDADTTHSIQLNWYDTTLQQTRPVTMERLGEAFDSWGYSDREWDVAMAFAASASVPNFADAESCRVCYPEHYTLQDWTQKAWKVLKNVFWNGIREGSRIKGAITVAKDYRAAASARRFATASYTWKEFYRAGITSTGEAGLFSRLMSKIKTSALGRSMSMAIKLTGARLGALVPSLGNISSRANQFFFICQGLAVSSVPDEMGRSHNGSRLRNLHVCCHWLGHKLVRLGHGTGKPVFYLLSRVRPGTRTHYCHHTHRAGNSRYSHCRGLCLFTLP